MNRPAQFHAVWNILCAYEEHRHEIIQKCNVTVIVYVCVKLFVMWRAVRGCENRVLRDVLGPECVGL